MTDIRAKGFSSKRQLDQHLAERDGAAPEPADGIDLGEFRRSAETELAWLRKEVAELRQRLANLQGRNDKQLRVPDKDHPWLRMAVTVGATFILGKLVQRFRLGEPGAAALPLVVAQLNRLRW